MSSSSHPYFAYGSNLNRADLLARCPDARPGESARLEGWRLRLRGVADIEPAEGHTAHGALWWLSSEDLVNLDSYEGVPSHYRRCTVEITMEAGGLEAMTYVMTKQHSYLGLPSPWYFGRIETGFRDWGLPLQDLQGGLEDTRDELERLGVEDFRPDGRKRLRAIF